MECAPFANHHFQMGVTVMGFAEDLGQSMTPGFQTFFFSFAVRVERTVNQAVATFANHHFQMGVTVNGVCRGLGALITTQLAFHYRYAFARHCFIQLATV